MEVRAGGPLSYDLTVPDRDPSAQRGIIRGLLAIVAMWLVATVSGWFALGVFADPRAVVRVFPLSVVAVAVAVTFLSTRRTLRRPRQHALLFIGGTSAAVALITFSTLGNVKPTIPQIRQQLDDVALPPGFRVESEEQRGDRFCRNGCPRVDRVYTTPAGDPDPVRTMVLALFDSGWQRASDVPPELATTARRGEIFVQLDQTGPTTVRVIAARQS